MCGICGIINFDNKKINSNNLNKINLTQSHRGPDNNSLWIEKNIGLGHTRLSIIDLNVRSNQPMLNSSKRYVISFNGEIYNFLELKKILLKKNYKFNTAGDTEVILNSYIEWGLKAFEKLNGMFSLAIWDRKLKKLILARDRYGIKPLFYSFNDKFLIFASEVKAIKLHNKIQNNIDHEALLEYFTFQNIFTNKNISKDILTFPQASYCVIDTENKNKKIQFYKYWDYSFTNSTYSKYNRKDYEELISTKIQNSVKKQLISDVNLGSYLSGGIDSAAIVAFASKEINNLSTFTCGFDLSSASGIELAFDERNKAEQLAHKFQSNHFQTVLKAGDMERILSKMTYYLDEPRVGQSYPNFYISKLASKFVSVILSGIGGDELFGGYPWRYYICNKNTSFNQFIESYYQNWQRLLNKEEIKKLFDPILSQVKNVETKEIFRNIFGEYNTKIESRYDSLNRSMYFELKTFLPGLLHVEDSLSMAHSLETRVPFLDNDLVDLVTLIPPNYKFSNFENSQLVNENNQNKYKKYKSGKILLRRSLKKILPNNILNDYKQGFSGPDASWFRGESINYVRKKILNKNALIYNFFDRKTVYDLINQHINRKKNRRLLIWSFLNFEEFLLHNL